MSVDPRVRIKPEDLQITAEIRDNPFEEYIEVEVTAKVIRCIRVPTRHGLSKGEAIALATDRMKHYFDYVVFR